MQPSYSEPFKLFLLRLPDGSKRQLTDKAEAERLAQDSSAVVVESRFYYTREFFPGAKGSRRVNTRAETLFLAREWKKARIRSGAGVVSRAARGAVSEASKAWLESLKRRRRAENTLREYGFVVAKWNTAFGSRPIASIAKRDIEDFLAARERIPTVKGKARRASARTMNLTLVLLRAFFRWAAREGLADSDPTAGIERLREPKREPRVLSPDELKNLLRACREPYGLTVGREKHRPYEAEQSFTPPSNLFPVAVCALTTCLRYSNVVNLRWRDLDLAKGELHVEAESTKTKTELVIPIGRAFKECLALLPKGQPEDFVFACPEADVKPRDEAPTVERSFRSALKRAGVRRASFHALRRTASTWLDQHGVPTAVILHLCGWSTGRSVFHSNYRHVDWSELQSAVATLDGLILGKAGEPAKVYTLAK